MYRMYRISVVSYIYTDLDKRLAKSGRVTVLQGVLEVIVRNRQAVEHLLQYANKQKINTISVSGAGLRDRKGTLRDGDDAVYHNPTQPSTTHHTTPQPKQNQTQQNTKN